MKRKMPLQAISLLMLVAFFMSALKNTEITDTQNEIPTYDRYLNTINGYYTPRGYIIKLNEKPILEKKAELDKEIKEKIISEDEALQKLNNHKNKIINQQNLAKNDFKRAIKNSGIKREYKNVFNGFLIDLSLEDINKIKNSVFVEKIYPNLEVSAELNESASLINADDVWNLSYTGQGKTIAIIDTGVDYNHIDLGGCFGASCKVVGGYDFVNDDTNPMDDQGHGTHVAAIAAGNGILKGVAPDAGIYAYKVLNSGGTGYFSDVIAAIERSVDPNNDGDYLDHADVISMSLGASCLGYSPDICGPEDPQSQAVDNAANNGVVVVVAAGNSASFASINSPGTARKAITAGATDKNDILASFSSKGPTSIGTIKPDIVAPGVSICAAQWDNAWASNQCIDNKHTSISGTSMATPHVSGAAALLLQKNPTWKPDEIKHALRNTALNLGYSVLQQGYGRLDVLQAVLLNNKPPIAILNTSGIVRGTIGITGTAASSNFASYRLEYAQGDSKYFNPTNWILLSEFNTLADGILMPNWDTIALDEGDYTLKLTVMDTFGTASQDRTIVTVNNVDITYPEEEQVIGHGTITIVGTAQDAGFQNYILEWGVGKNPATWLSDGITLLNNGQIPIVEGALAIWNTSSISSSSYYSIRLTVNSVDISKQEIRTIYVDPSLQTGWPQQIEDNCENLNVCPTVIYNPTIADIDGDNKFEVLTGTSALGGPSNVHVFRHDGTIAAGWPKKADYGLFGSPAVSDINLDGIKEVVIIDKSPGFEKLKIWSSNGTLLNKFAGGSYCTVLADIDKDFPGEEIIFSTNTLYVKHYDGTTYWQNIFSTSTNSNCVSVGDINNNGKLDIITVNATSVFAFDEDGIALAGWPQATNSPYIYSTPSVGDIDNDGTKEIVIGTSNGEVYAWHYDGTIVSGFPVNIGSAIVGSAALGDVDGDNVTEIAITNYNKYIYVIKSNGTIAPGWPQPGVGSTPVIGDIDSDGDMELIDGNYAYHHNGVLVDGFPKHLQHWVGPSKQSSSALADLDNDGDIELVIGPTEFDFRIYVYDLLGIYNPDSIEWGMVRHDERHTGMYKSKIEVNTPPIANAGPDQVANDVDGDGIEIITLDGSASSDLDGAVVGYEWLENSLLIANGVNPALSFSIGIHNVTLRVTDNSGAIDTDAAVITINPNQAPIANAGTDQTAEVNKLIIFNGSGSYDPDGSIASYQWNFGDGNTASGQIATHSYSTAGNFTVALTVTDNGGLTAQDTARVSVVAPKDIVNIIKAEYSPSKKQLRVDATSSRNGEAVLTVKNFGTMTYDSDLSLYRLTANNVLKNPGTVTVTSSFGGTDTEAVRSKGK